MRSPEDALTDPDLLIRLGTIATVDLGAAHCTVALEDDVESGPVRWIEGRMGATRIWSPPTVGEQVVLLCPAGEIAGGVALRGIVSNDFAPAGNSLRELIEFADGAVIAYDPENHVLDAILPAGATLNIAANGGIAIVGDIALNGNIDMTGTLTADGDVVASGISLNSHVHGGIQSGGSNTSGPS